jgi:hypothetical protein
MTDAADIDVSIIIVSYNTRAMTLACLASIGAQTHRVSTEIIVVDNNSPDGSAQAIGEVAPHARLLARADNLGFARANNLAAQSARGEYILLLNPDTVVVDGAIERLVAFARRRPQAQIWGGRTIFADGRLNATFCFRALSPWNLFCRVSGLAAAFPRSRLFHSEVYGGRDLAGERAVDVVTGCFLLIPRALWQRLGGFDRAFYMYGEEVDLCLRARRLGAAPAVTPEATIIHHGGASETTRAEKMVKVLAAKSTLIRRHWPPAWRPLGLAMLAAWPLTRACAQRLRGSSHGAITDARRTAWREVWARRCEWFGGYDAQAVGSGADAGSGSHGPAAATASAPAASTVR